MNIKTIKKLIRKERVLIKELMLTDYQLKVVEFVESVEEATSGDIVKWQDCSLQSAHNILSKLKSNGWLSRTEVKDPTGGLMFVYKVKSD